MCLKILILSRETPVKDYEKNTLECVMVEGGRPACLSNIGNSQLRNLVIAHVAHIIISHVPGVIAIIVVLGILVPAISHC
jgi:hypothetical protein